MAVESTQNVQVHVVFAELTGAVEQALAAHPGPDAARALWLLESLASLWRGGQKVDVQSLTLGEFDGCLADLYASLFGTRLPCEAECVDCEERFEFELDLFDLRRAIASEGEGFSIDADGIVTAPSARRFRLPRVADLTGIGKWGWLEQFVVAGDANAEALESEMEAAACVLSQDIEAPCPDCGKTNTIRFDIARYLVETLRGESAFLWREVHLLALNYGWALHEILALMRNVRRQLAGLVVAESSARLRRAS
jgi:hypothetical protein